MASLQSWSSKKNELIKIAVIYEAEYLTPEAQNSILKILEDTPSKTLIVLCTSDVANLLQTIKSRCKIYKIDYEQSRENSILNKLENSNLLQREKVLYELLTDNTKKNIQKLIENLIREHLQSKKQNKNMIEFLYKMQIANYNGANPKLILDNINFKLSQ